jgi:major membrane immunogen (membrane-anchored lipoprotein)
MKFFRFLVISLLFFTACQAQDKSKTISSTETGSKIQIIDFHSTHRCKTCLKIEDNTKKVLQTNFKKEMDAGTLSFQTVNIDEEANYKKAERFEAAGTALFINVIKNGKEQHIDLTNFAFAKAFDDEAFTTTLKAKIDEQLKTL